VPPEQVRVNANFVADLEEFCAATLARIGHPHAPSVDEMKSAWPALDALLNLAHRQVRAVPRKVVLSLPLQQQLADDSGSEPAAGLRRVAAMLERGANVGPYQSKLSVDLTKHDHLLNDWNIHHLHLGAHTDGARFARRTGPLLFAWIDDDVAYLIDILDHSSFAELRLLEIIHAEWPRLLVPFHCKHIVDIEPELTAADRVDYRAMGITMMVKLACGLVLAPAGGGAMTSQLSRTVRKRADQCLNEAASLERWCRENSDELVVRLAEATGLLLNELVLKYRPSTVGPSVVEESTTRCILKIE
jgi:hypothetical protein